MKITKPTSPEYRQCVQACGQDYVGKIEFEPILKREANTYYDEDSIKAIQERMKIAAKGRIRPECPEEALQEKQEAQENTSGTKHDQDKPMLIYNYFDAWYLSEVQSDILDNHCNYLRNIKMYLDNGQCCEAMDIIKKHIQEEAGSSKLFTDEVIASVSQVCHMGAKKYGNKNYLKGIHYDRLLSAAMRHYIKGMGELDVESGLPHYAHYLSNLLMLLELISVNKHRG